MDTKWIPENIVNRINFNAPNGCWEWSGGINNKGYGTVWINGKAKKTHRVMYELFFGKFPDGLVSDHVCRNRACVNPYHIEPVTARVNTLRGYGTGAINSRKTHCINGHELNGDNLYKSVNPKHAARICRLCHYVRQIRYKVNNRERINKMALDKHRQAI